MSWTTRLWIAAALGCACLFGSIAARAQQQTDPIVYWPLVTDGREYRRVAYPAEAGPILVLAGTEIVIDPRRAPVSFWPITREYLADMPRSTPLAGLQLEIVDGSGDVRTVEAEPYLVWYAEGVGASAATLVRGDAVATAYDDYVRKARAALAAMQAYQKVRAEHQALIEAWLRMAGERRGENMPKPPPVLELTPPEPYRAFATEPAEAFVLALPAGIYTIRLRRPDGTMVPDSERRLVSFAPLQQGVGYVIRQEDRWTEPLASFAPDEVIYTTGRSPLYFEPIAVAEYEARRITRLFRPQSAETNDPSLTLWAPIAGAEAPDAPLVLRDGRTTTTVPQTGFRVEQMPGRARGYTIEEFAPKPGASLAPDFVAARVAPEGMMRLGLSGADGAAVEASERRIRVVAPPSEALLFLPALLPLAVAAGVKVVSRRRRRAGGTRGAAARS
jgi:hypothetical protein